MMKTQYFGIFQNDIEGKKSETEKVYTLRAHISRTRLFMGFNLITLLVAFLCV